MEMLYTRMSCTMSTSPRYCPREPTEIPCEPLQWRFCTRMSVLFGLKETQSTNPFFVRGLCAIDWFRGGLETYHRHC